MTQAPPEAYTIARFVLAARLLSPTLAAAQAPDPCATAPQTCATLINTHATARTRIPNTAVDVSLSIKLQPAINPSPSPSIS